jgi:hypothetical protein
MAYQIYCIGEWERIGGVDGDGAFQVAAVGESPFDLNHPSLRAWPSPQPAVALYDIPFSGRGLCAYRDEADRSSVAVRHHACRRRMGSDTQQRPFSLNS